MIKHSLTFSIKLRNSTFFAFCKVYISVILSSSFIRPECLEAMAAVYITFCDQILQPYPMTASHNC